MAGGGDVEWTITKIGQANTKACWHACYKMMYSWKGKPTSDVDKKWPNPGMTGTNTENGLMASQWRTAAAVFGLYGYPGNSLKDIERMQWCLEKCGPILCNGRFLNGHLHTIIVGGIRVSSNKLLIYDPWEFACWRDTQWLDISWWSTLVDTRPFACQLWW